MNMNWGNTDRQTDGHADKYIGRFASGKYFSM